MKHFPDLKKFTWYQRVFLLNTRKADLQKRASLFDLRWLKSGNPSYRLSNPAIQCVKLI